MKMNKRLIALTAALAVTGVMVGASVAASGDMNDPLVTMSYLDKVVVPDLVSQVDAKAAARQKEMEKSFSDQVKAYQKEAQSGGSSSASFQLVTMKKNQVLHLGLGCELMLRVGTAKVNSEDNPALIDSTLGETVKKDTELVKNRLYLATIPDRSVTATANTVKLLVRGEYTVK